MFDDVLVKLYYTNGFTILFGSTVVCIVLAFLASFVSMIFSGLFIALTFVSLIVGVVMLIYTHENRDEIADRYSSE